METKTICAIHDKILHECDKRKGYIRLKDYDEQDLLKAAEELLDILSDIEDLTHKAKVCGERMENRLVSYREGIESLGFTRVKK